MTPLPADHAARERARTSFDHPVVVEAGAGTGKTAVLVMRVVTWLLGPGWARNARDGATVEDTAIVTLQRVLALTFTEKAAGEMAVRVAEGLEVLANGKSYYSLSADSFEDLPSVDRDDLIRQRARACLIHLDRLSVTTIHGWCRRVLVGHPIEAALHPAFEVDADGMGRRAVLDEVIAEWVAGSFGSSPDGDAMALAAAEHGPDAIWTALGALAEAGTDPDDIDVDPFSQERFAEARDRLRPALDEVAGAFAPFATMTGRSPNSKAAALWLLDFRTALSRAAGFADLTAHLTAEDAGTATDRLKTWSKGEFNATEKNTLPALDMKALAESLLQVKSTLAVWTRLEIDLLPPAARILRALLERTNTRLHGRGVVSFNDLLSRADALLEIPAVRGRVRAQYDQLLVDEFQDTDRRQYDIVSRLALEGDVATRPGLFLVGDPKQSIYGWRQADLLAYERFLDRLREAHGTEPLALTVNFRSVPAILEEVERIMAPTMIASRGLQPAFEPLQACAERSSDPGFAREDRRPVEYWVSWVDDPKFGSKVRMKTTKDAARPVEAAAIAADIRHLHDAHEVPWKSFGMLFRAKTSLEKYLHALRQAGVPFLVEGDREFYSRREVLDAVNFIRVVLDPNDHIALVGLIRSPMVGVPDAALIPLWGTRFPQLMSELDDRKTRKLADVGEAIATARAGVPDDVPAEALIDGWEHTLTEATLAVARLRRSFAEDAADVFVERLRAALLTEPLEGARYLGAHRAANLDQIFRKILEALTSGQGGTDTVLRVLKERIEDIHPEKDATVAQDEIDAVRVMTIHMSKGLAFEHVYLPDLHREDQDREADDARVAIAGNGSREARLLKMPTAGWGDIRARERAIREAEQVRLLYVAVTRAKQRLVLIGAWGEPARMRPVSMLGLIASRPGTWADTLLRWNEDIDSAPPFEDDAHGARWRLLPQPAAHGSPAAAIERPRPDIDALRARSERWLSETKQAHAHAGRPVTLAASAGSHEAVVETTRDRTDRLEEPGDLGEPDGAIHHPAPATDTTFARQIGTAVHRVLERLDLTGDPVWSCAQATGRFRSELADLVPPAQLDRAVAAGQPLIDSLPGSPLIAHLFEIAEHIVGREVPFLTNAATVPGCAATGAVVGAIDLLYRDPADGRFVVADFKTDRVADDGGADLDAHARAYRSQGDAYVTAVQQAFALDHRPRFELWFLQHGVIR